MLAGFDRDCNGSIDISVTTENVHASYFDLYIHAVAGDVYQVSVGWLAFPDDTPNLVVGSIPLTSTAVLQQWATQKAGHVIFPQGKFFTPLKVLVALNGFAFGSQFQLRLQTAATNVYTTGFDWSVSEWAGSQFIDAGVTYIAFSQ